MEIVSMDLFVRVLLLTMILINRTGSQDLTGPNVCVNSVSRKIANKIDRTFYSRNCEDGRPTCQITRKVTIYRTIYESQKSCCSGWQRAENNCLTPCSNNTHGVNCSGICNCTTANSYCDPVSGCSCNPGWQPPNCSIPCDSQSYGFACKRHCTCLNGASCDPVNGSCSCPPGWMGDTCNTSCPTGVYGVGCASECTCFKGESCDHVTGNCSCPSGSSCVFTSRTPSSGIDMYDQSGIETSIETDYRHSVIVTPIVVATVIIVIVIGVILCKVSKSHDIVTRDAKANGGEIPTIVADTLPPAPSPSLEEGETTEEDGPAPGNPADGPAAPTTVTVHGENNEAAAEAPAAPVAAEAPAAPVSAGLVRGGTARRNKRDELPPTLPRPPCSWAEDENAYCELGGGHKPAIAPKPKLKARAFERRRQLVEEKKRLKM